MKITIPDKLDISAEDRKLLEKYESITIYDDVVNEPTEIIRRIKDAEIISANYIDLTKEIIEASPNLKYIISPAVGYDWIDVKTATEKGITVVNCPTFNTYAVAEHAIALIFAVYRRIVESQLHILAGKWNPISLTGREVRGKKLLTIGHGNIGKAILKLATGLGMSVDFTDSSTSAAETDKKIANSDIVVLCFPLNENTKGFFNKERIQLLNKDAILINVARGLVLDQESLFSALSNNKILGAGLDVFNRDETLTSGREDIIDFAKLPNAVTTPHIGFNTLETQKRFGTEFLKNIDSILAGNPINAVNQ